MGRGPKPTKGKASPAVPGKLRANEEARVPDLEKRLAEALRDKAEAQEQLQTRDRELAEAREQRTATSEILRVISASPSDTQPVFDTILANAVRLCDAKVGQLLFRDGEDLRWAASYGATVAIDELLRGTVYKAPASALRPRGPWRPLQIRDLRETEPYRQGWPTWREQVDVEGARTVVAVPLVKGDRYLGSVCVYRREVRPFTDSQVELLRTFADQAVIAIENVRLFKELEARNRELTEALEQQTATSEILRVISSSPTDVQPVFDAIVQSAVRLCDGLHGVVDRFDGELIHFAAQYNYTPEALQMTQRMYPRQPDRKQAAGRAILTGDVVNIADVQADPEYATDLAVAGGWRSILNVPMLREGKPIGTIGVIRGQAGRFSDAQVELLRTFADQAVIAIENVRLFTELQEKNQALTQAHAQVTEALEQQTATSEILRVISSSPTDLQPVFDAIAQSAARLCESLNSNIYRLDRDRLLLVAYHGPILSGLRIGERAHATPVSLTLGRGTAGGQAVLDGRIIHVADMQTEADEFPESSENARRMGFRTILCVPLMRDGGAIGVIALLRAEARLFTERQVALLKTFADQAVIAIENVRLFKELQTSNRDLTTALDKQTATSDILRVISQSQTDVQPVFDAIVSSGVRLLGGYGGTLTRVEGDEITLAAFTRSDEASDAATRARFPQPLHSAEGHAQAVRHRTTFNIVDVPADLRLAEAQRTSARLRGYRSLVLVPLLRHEEALGTLGVSRREPGGFTDDEIALLKTFADQAVIAIENVRLFKELEAANRELAAASQHKSEFLANMSHELRTPLNAIIGFSEVLSDRMFGELNEKQEEYLKDIYASGTHLLSLINDILDLSKIEAGRMELELTEFDLPTAIDNALMLVRERAGRRSIALHTNIDDRLGGIQADERKVRQVVLNLLSNAIKFTSEGGRIDVGAVPKDGLVEVSVSDTGIGIAPEDQETVFEEFRQVGTAAKKVEGTGLGLTLCRKYVELHGGRIWVKSQEGVGSTFTFTIPVRQRGE